MNDLKRHWRSGLKTICVLVILIWIVEAANSFFGHGFNTFGIYPRDVDTLPGILLWPLLHGSLKHLIMNTTPLLERQRTGLIIRNLVSVQGQEPY